mmetsp:Transcript_2834/g.4450  ORF Transcript_2834/g.4450 Transcript_2834/m.4450 type:complete len:348 (-) Transcript_2834:264-1307(-)
MALPEAIAPLVRPTMVLIAALLAWNLNVTILKAKLTIQGIVYLIFCNDKKWKKPEDPGLVLKSAEGVEKKTVIFVRHGESTWNDTFNKGERSVLVFVIFYLPNLLKALLYETYLCLTGQIDSWFYDSPMSHYGLEQVQKLADFLGKKPEGTDREVELLKILRGDEGAPSSKIVSSNLRRAISTVAAGFSERLKRRPDDKILIIPSLQEISRNPDTLSITPAHENVTASWIEKEATACNFQAIFDKQCDMSSHTGNKPLDTNGLKRMLEFSNYVFTVDEDVVIAGGHSIWFRSYFRTFLPYDSNHPGKNRKVVNCGAVAFTLLKKGEGADAKFAIDPDTVDVVYGGFS